MWACTSVVIVAIAAAALATTAIARPYIVWSNETVLGNAPPPINQVTTQLVPLPNPKLKGGSLVIDWGTRGESGEQVLVQLDALTGWAQRHFTSGSFTLGDNYAISLTDSSSTSVATVLNLTSSAECEYNHSSPPTTTDQFSVSKDYVVRMYTATGHQTSEHFMVLLRVPSHGGACDTRREGTTLLSLSPDPEVFFTPRSTSFYLTGGFFFHPDDFTGGIDNVVEPFCIIRDENAISVQVVMGSENFALAYFPSSMSFTCVNLTSTDINHCFPSSLMPSLDSDPLALTMATNNMAAAVMRDTVLVIDVTTCSPPINDYNLPFVPKTPLANDTFPKIAPSTSTDVGSIVVVQAIDDSFWAVNTLTTNWTKLPWSGICDMGNRFAACVSANGSLTAYELLDPTVEAGTISLSWFGGEIAPILRNIDDFVFVAWQSGPSAAKGHAAAITGFRTLTQTVPVPSRTVPPTATHTPSTSNSTSRSETATTRSPSTSLSHSDTIRCWDMGRDDCLQLPDVCAWNKVIDGCVDVAWINASCPEIAALNPFGGGRAGSCALGLRCEWCNKFDLCFAKTPGFECPARCLQVPTDLCDTATGCHFQRGYCSENVCFSFLREGFEVMPLVMFVIAVTKASIVLLLWSLFGSTLLRAVTHAQKGFHRATPLIVTDEGPMYKGDPLPRLATALSTVDTMDEYVQALLVQNFGVANASAEERDRVAHVLFEYGEMVELFGDDREPIACDDGNDQDIAMRVECALANRHQVSLETLQVCYVSSRRVSSRFANAINVFPGNVMLSCYLFFAFLLLGMSVSEIAHYDEPWQTKYELIAFRLINSSLPVSVAFVAIKWMRGAALRLRYVTHPLSMPLSHRAEVHRFRRVGADHMMFFVYMGTIVPFMVLAVYGAVRFLYVPLLCFLGASVVSFGVRPQLHRFISWASASASCERRGDEHELISSERASAHEGDGLYGSTATNDVSEKLARAGDATTPRPQPAPAAEALHALVSFLTIDAVWCSAFSIGSQMCFNYSVMLLHLSQFGITANSVPKTEYAARSTDCLLYRLHNSVAELSIEASHVSQLLSSVFPFF